HNVEAEAEPVDPEQEEYERNIRAWEEENDDDHLWKSEGKQTMFSSEIDVEEMYNPLYHHGQVVPKETPSESLLKRKAWLSAATDNSEMFHKREASGTNGVKRKKGRMPLAQRLSSCRHHISRWKRQNRNNAEERIGTLRA
ncbi:hypothetical protein HID58_064754, partial [Brassica napus]